MPYSRFQYISYYLISAVSFIMLFFTMSDYLLSMHYLLITAVIILFIVKHDKRKLFAYFNDRLVMFFMFFWALSITSILIQEILFIPKVDKIGVNAYNMSLSYAILSIIYFVFGLLLRFESIKNMGFQPVIFITIAGLIITNGTFGFVNYENINIQFDNKVTHFMLSDAIVLLTFSGVVLTRGIKRIYVGSVGSLLLFLIQGRTAFYCTLLSMLLVGLFNKIRSNIWILIIGIFVLFTVWSEFDVASDLNIQEMRERMIVSGGIKDPSLMLRGEALIGAITDLDKYLILGDINWAINNYGAWGLYVHNLLSYWIQYGFLVFVLIIFIIKIVLERLIKNLNDERVEENPDVYFRMLMGVYALLSVFLAKSFAWNWFWFVVGLFVFVSPYVIEDLEKNNVI